MILNGDIKDAFVQLSGLGLAAIIENSTGANATLRWLDQERMEVDSTLALSDDQMAEIVLDHMKRTCESEWLNCDEALDKKQEKDNERFRSPLSPRVGSLNQAEYLRFEETREVVIDSLDTPDYLTQGFLSALGRSAYWAFTRRGGNVECKPDSGASYWEMSDRRRGDDFVRCRLRQLAQKVSKRDVQTVRDGLSGLICLDELGNGAYDSTTPTGLRQRSKSDNACAWCALWAISLFPTRPVVSVYDAAHSITVGACNKGKNGVYFYLPIFENKITLQKYRMVLRGASLKTVCSYASLLASRANNLPPSVSIAADIEKLKAAMVKGIIVFRRTMVSDGNAVDYWAEEGTVYLLSQLKRRC